MHPTKFTMGQTMIINWVWGINWMSWGKHKKVQNFFYSNRKKVRKVDKGKWEYYNNYLQNKIYW